MEKNGCQTIVTRGDGSEEVRGKKRFESFKEAEAVSKIHMSYKGVSECLVPYKCKLCGGYHIGRNGKILTDIEKRTARRDADVISKKAELARLKSFKPKIVGKINLDLISKGKSERTNK